MLKKVSEKRREEENKGLIEIEKKKEEADGKTNLDREKNPRNFAQTKSGTKEKPNHQKSVSEIKHERNFLFQQKKVSAMPDR